MPRSRDSNTKVYKVRNDMVYMAMGYLSACHKYGNDEAIVYIDETVAKFNLTDIEVAVMMQKFTAYLTELEEQN